MRKLLCRLGIFHSWHFLGREVRGSWVPDGWYTMCCGLRVHTIRFIVRRSEY